MALIRFRRGSTGAWAVANPVLAAGEPGFATDTYVLKVGNGVNAWDTLPTLGGGGSGSGGDATTTVKGIVELATNAEAATGTDTVRALTPANVKPLLDAKAPVPTGSPAAGKYVDGGTGAWTALPVGGGGGGVALGTTPTTAVANGPAGVLVVMQFPFTDYQVARPAVAANVRLNWVGNPGPSNAAPTNMRLASAPNLFDGDTFDIPKTS